MYVRVNMDYYYMFLLRQLFRTVKFGLLKRTLVVGGFLLKNYRKSKAVNKINNNLNAQIMIRKVKV